MVFNKTEEQEKEYLRQIINTINDSINNTDKSVKEHVDTLQEYKEYLWSNKDIDPHEIRSMRESILRHFATGESVIDKRKLGDLTRNLTHKRNIRQLYRHTTPCLQGCSLQRGRRKPTSPYSRVSRYGHFQ